MTALLEMRSMLVQLSKLLQPDEVGSMKFLCKDIIPLRRREEIKNSIDLFNELEQRGKLKWDDVSFIEYLLRNACSGRTDVLETFSTYKPLKRSEFDVECGCGANENQQRCNSTGGTSDVFTFLEDNLGREYLMFLRRLGVEDQTLDRIKEENPHNVREVIHKSLGVWHSSNCKGSCLAEVIAALKAEKRKDLAMKLERRPKN